MAVKLTDDQMKIVKGMMEYSQKFADQMLHVMKNHGLDKINGCYLRISVDPEMRFTTKMVQIGKDLADDFGKIDMSRGAYHEKYTADGVNSPEYEYLFADEAVRRELAKILYPKKPLPPDGLWIGDSRNDPPVDGWEWDLNDSLS